ncbi:MAG: toprim domain-containing protein [Saprospiraceae bacterium]
MLMNPKTISTQEAKRTISIVDYLEKHGYKYVGMSGNRYKYLSVFRSESEPSMFVDDSKGLFKDFGNDIGGSIIDLAKNLHKFRTVSETLQHLAEFRGSSALLRTSTSNQTAIFSENKNIHNIRIQPLNHFVILQYLENERKINKSIAKKYMKLVWYDNQLRGGLFAMGWKNDSGAWELRSAGEKSFKTVTGTKDITTISGKGRGDFFVFESMLDYLSLLMMKQIESLDGDVFILNSTSLVKRLIPILENQKIESIHTFFDNDDGGRKALKKLQDSYSQPFKIHQADFYDDYEDVNDFWVSQ